MGMPEGAATPAAKPAESLLASFAVKAVLAVLDKGIDNYFGLEVGRVIDEQAPLPWVVIWNGGAAVAHMEAVDSAGKLDPVIRLGVEVAKAARW